MLNFPIRHLTQVCPMLRLLTHHIRISHLALYSFLRRTISAGLEVLLDFCHNLVQDNISNELMCVANLPHLG